MIKKVISILAIFVVVLSGCSSESNDKITVGASSVPHAEILEAARPIIQEAGYELEVVVFDDYIMPNKALENGDLDANYFQHVPYLNSQIEEFGYDFTPVANIHVEPINVYSKKYSNIDEIEDGSTILLSNSVSDQARVLTLLEAEGLITLNENVDHSIATFEDITSNPKNIEFDYDYDPSLLPSIYNNNEGDLVAINTNYALANDVDFSEAIFKESKDSDYSNALVVRSDDIDNEKTKVLKEALTSQTVSDFINESYNGAVIPSF